MNTSYFYKRAAMALLLLCVPACTKLDQKVYSALPNSNFWQTPDQIKAGVAPVYQQLTNLANGNTYNLNEVSSDEQIIPTRGNDWYDGGKWQQLWLHTWTPETNTLNDAWNEIFGGIGKANFILSIINNLPQKPDNVDAISAEVKTVRAYYYYLAMDLFGNVPLVSDFNTDPNSVTNSARVDIYKFIESDLRSAIPLLPETVDGSTFGRATKWMGFALLAKLYLNAEVFTGTANYAAAGAACDSIIKSGKYQLEPGYFDNFQVKNQGSRENIFVVPFNNAYIPNNNWENETLHYQSVISFGMTGGSWNGYSSMQAFYNLFDTVSTYTTNNGNVYRTYRDQRSGTWLVGQQFSTRYPYPPDKNVMVRSADPSLALKDAQTNLPLVYDPNIDVISNPADIFRTKGVRNIKYFPEAGTASSQSNAIVVFRLADILLMKAEVDIRLGSNLGEALTLINQVRERAYSGDAGFDFTPADLTLDKLLAERGRELSWESWRRNDLIRFGTFGQARTPGKVADNPDGHLKLYPIPGPQLTANPNLKQNPGYTP